MASNRRAFLTATAVGALVTAPTTATAVGTRPRPTTAPAALAELLDGNRRYAGDHPRHPDESRAPRRDLLCGLTVAVVALKDAVGELRGRGIEVRITGVEHGHRRVLESLGVLLVNPNPNRGAIPSAAGATAP